MAILEMILNKLLGEAVNRVLKGMNVTGNGKNNTAVLDEMKDIKSMLDNESKRPLEVCINVPDEFKTLALSASKNLDHLAASSSQTVQILESGKQILNSAVDNSNKKELGVIFETIQKCLNILTGLLAHFEKQAHAVEMSLKAITVQLMRSMRTIRICCKMLSVCVFVLAFMYAYSKTSSDIQNTSLHNARVCVLYLVAVLIALSPLWIFEISPKHLYFRLKSN